MRTCPNCGCYVPDRWITCPACEARVKVSKEALAPHNTTPTTKRDLFNALLNTEAVKNDDDLVEFIEHKTTSKVFPEGVYRVKVYYKDDTMIDTIYCSYENALKHAQYTIDKFWYYVQFIEVWDCKRKVRLGLFYPNS